MSASRMSRAYRRYQGKLLEFFSNRSTLPYSRVEGSLIFSVIGTALITLSALLFTRFYMDIDGSARINRIDFHLKLITNRVRNLDRQLTTNHQMEINMTSRTTFSR